MILSNDAGPQGLIRVQPGNARVIARVILELASEEVVELFDYWLTRKQCNDRVVAIVMYRRIFGELLGFFVCLTERFAQRHGVVQRTAFGDAVADAVREEALIDPRSSYPPGRCPDIDYDRARVLTSQIERIRSRYRFRRTESIVAPALLDATAWSIALPLSVSPNVQQRKNESPVIRKRLMQLAEIFLESYPLADLGMLPGRGAE